MSIFNNHTPSALINKFGYVRRMNSESSSDDSETICPDKKKKGKMDPHTAHSLAVYSLLETRLPYTKPVKIGHLEAFINSDLSPLVDNDAKTALLTLQKNCVNSKGTSKRSKRENWGAAYIAGQLAEAIKQLGIYKELTESMVKQAPKTRPSNKKTPEAILLLNRLNKMYIVELEKIQAKKEAAAAEAVKKRAKLKKTTGTPRPHEQIEFDRSEMLIKPCPSCGHYYTTYLQSREEIEDFNNEIDEAHRKKLRQYNAMSKSAQQATKKPRKPRKKECEIGCFCFQIHCLDAPDGGKCPQCQRHTGFGMSYLVNGRCTRCFVCSCKCDVVFTETERKAIADSVDPKSEQSDSDEDITTSKVFRGMEERYTANANKQYLSNPTASKEQIARDAHAATFHDMLSDPVFGTAKARKRLQDEVGPIKSTSKDGKTIDQLRAEKKGVTPDPTGDSRFYRNRLQEHPMDPTRFLRNNNTANRFSETPCAVEGIGSRVQPISIDGAELLCTPIKPSRKLSSGPPERELLIEGELSSGRVLSSDTPPSELSSDTPPFLRSMREAANEKADFQENSQPTLEILDHLGDTLTAENNSEEASRIKRKATDLAKRGKDPDECLPKMVDWCKRQKIPAKDKK